jgi:hypothetical protein
MDPDLCRKINGSGFEALKLIDFDTRKYQRTSSTFNGGLDLPRRRWLRDWLIQLDLQVALLRLQLVHPLPQLVDQS